MRCRVGDTSPHIEICALIGKIADHVKVHRVFTFPQSAAVEDQIVVVIRLEVELKALVISLHEEVATGILDGCCKGMKKDSFCIRIVAEVHSISHSRLINAGGSLLISSKTHHSGSDSSSEVRKSGYGYVWIGEGSVGLVVLHWY